MEIAEHIDALDREGELLAAAAEEAGPEAVVPTCPDWVVRDLVLHLGGVHRWAAAHVRQARATPLDAGDIVAGQGGPPADADLVEWFRAGHRALVDALVAAPDDLDCWSFLAAPSPLAFWARRQAHETGIHRVDAQAAVNAGSITPFPADLAADGIDELLAGFVPHPRGKLRTDPPRQLEVRPSDGDRAWIVRISTEPVVTTVSDADGVVDPAPDCSVAGPASDLYQWLWNRRGPGNLTIVGDGSLLGLWRETVQVRWR